MGADVAVSVTSNSTEPDQLIDIWKEYDESMAGVEYSDTELAMLLSNGSRHWLWFALFRRIDKAKVPMNEHTALRTAVYRLPDNTPFKQEDFEMVKAIMKDPSSKAKELLAIYTIPNRLSMSVDSYMAKRHCDFTRKPSELDVSSGEVTLTE